jgi:hypothetical protein
MNGSIDFLSSLSPSDTNQGPEPVFGKIFLLWVWALKILAKNQTMNLTVSPIREGRNGPKQVYIHTHVQEWLVWSILCVKVAALCSFVCLGGLDPVC